LNFGRLIGDIASDPICIDLDDDEKVKKPKEEEEYVLPYLCDVI